MQYLLSALFFIYITCHAFGFSPQEKAIQEQLFCPNLYAPWRDSYVKSKIEQNDTISFDQQQKKECPFCLEIQENNDEKYLILKRYQYHCVLLNLYPYTKGHFLIVPMEHKATLIDFSKEARTEMMEIATICLDIIQNVLQCPGANVGFNIGHVAGASIPDHLHMHIIPRSNLDCTFIHLIGNVRITCCDLKEMYHELKPYF